MVAKWFTTGWEDALREREKLEALAKMSQERGAPMFWLKPEEEAEIMFVDDSPFNIYEHKIPVGERYMSYICTKEWEACPLCSAFPKDRPRYVNYFTVIDMRSYVDKTGKKIPYSKKLFGAKNVLSKMLYDIRKTKGALKHAVVRVKRYSATSSNTGDFIEFVRFVKNPAGAFGKENLIPFEYEKIFAPLTKEELERLGIAAQDKTIGREDIDVDDLLD